MSISLGNILEKDEVRQVRMMNYSIKFYKTTFVGVVLLSVRKTTTPNQTKPPHQTTTPNHHTKPPHHVITFKAVSGNLGSWFLVCNLYFNPTRLNMEDDINFFLNGRRPQFFQNGRRPPFLKMKDDLNFF